MTSARPQIAEGRKPSRWDRARLSLVVPIVVIVTVAIVCVVVAVLTSARRADDVSLGRERQLIEQAIADRGARVLREVESVAARPSAARSIRANYDAQWVEHSVGGWLQAFFRHDVVVVIDGSDQIKYALLAAPSDGAGVALKTGLVDILELLRGRRSALPSQAIPVIVAHDALKPGRRTALIQRFMNRPAIVAAVAVGSDGELASGNAGAPIVVAVKYIDETMLREIGRRLQLSGLHEIADPAQAGGEQITAINDVDGAAIAAFAWQPTRPGAEIVVSVLPFIAVAIAGFALLVGLIMRFMRRTAEAIAAGETQLRHLALHDPVCGLPNRIHFGERLESVIDRVRRGGPSAAVFYIDLDHFKDVNDTLGHHIGDELILNVTQRLSRVMRGDDLVARLGGDEFAVIQMNIGHPGEAGDLAARLIAALSASYDIQRHEVVIGASIGIALAPGDGNAADALLRNADMALYRAKADGRGTSHFFEPDMDRRIQARRILELDLRKAFANGEFDLHYQPLVNLHADRVSGFEALLRWHHPERGMVLPGEFIALAEEIGLIGPLGEWVLRRACTDAAGWPGDLKVAVNLSPAQFRSRGVVQAVLSALAHSGLPPYRLELEITESVLLGETEANLAILHQLREIGARISMDDFGTGYSSLSYLRSFPFDKIKIDRSFVRDLAERPDCMAIIRAVAGLGASLGISTTAEGVETREQLERLRAEGCTEAQGFLFSPPRPAADILSLLAVEQIRAKVA